MGVAGRLSGTVSPFSRNLLAPKWKFPTPQAQVEGGWGGSETGRAELRGQRAKIVGFGRAPRFLEVRGKLEETSKT